MSKIPAIAAAGTAVIALGIGVGFVVLGPESDEQFAPCRNGAIATGGNTLGGPFTLTSETGETVTETDVITKPTILYFGYTFCPDVCPLDLSRNTEAQRILETRGYDVDTLFITIDPARDTPEVMAEFTDYLHPKLLGLTGTQEQIDVAAKAYRVYAQKAESDDPEYYLMDHSAFSYLVDAEHGFLDIIRHEATTEDVVEMAACYLEEM